MSGYSRVDSEDDDRLPEGMRRVGYDADTQTYSYQAQDGSYWEGEPGVRYGELHRRGEGYRPMTLESQQAMAKGDKEAWRYMLPFFLLVTVVLLALFRFLGFGSGVSTPFACGEGALPYSVKPGDSCWAIANERGATVGDLQRLNEGLNCDLLKAGKEICVPVSE